MASHRLVAAVLALSACVPRAVVREALQPGAVVVARPGEPKPLEPHVSSAWLVHPVGCLELVQLGQGCADFACAGVALAVALGCAGVVTAVDLVAMPHQATVHARQRGQLEAVVASCVVDDPLPHVSAAVLGRLVSDHGFVAADAGDAPQDALSLVITTTRFTRSDRFRWEGAVVLRSPESFDLFSSACDVAAPARSLESVVSDCEAARAEVDGLATACAASVAAALRDVLGGPAARPGDPPGPAPQR